MFFIRKWVRKVVENVEKTFETTLRFSLS